MELDLELDSLLAEFIGYGNKTRVVWLHKEDHRLSLMASQKINKYLINLIRRIINSSK